MSEQEKLVNETLEEINAYLPKMIKGIEGFVESQLEGQESKKLLSNIFDGLEWIVQAVSLTNKFKPGDMKEQELMEIFPVLIKAYENNDYVLVGDILDYEIKPVLEKWAAQIQ